MNNIKRFTSLFVSICMLVTLFSGISVVYAAKNGAVIDFEQSELQNASNTNGQGLIDKLYVQDGYTVKSRLSHQGQSTYIAEGTHGKSTKVLVAKSAPSAAGSASHDPTQMITVLPDNSNRMSSTSQYFEVKFDLMMNGKSNLEFMGTAARGTESGRGMRLLAVANAVNKTATVQMAGDSTAISIAENHWNNFRFVFQSSDVTIDNKNGVNDDKHKYWVYVNGALVTSGENKFVTDRSGFVANFYGFDGLDIRMLPDFDSATKELLSNCELHLDNVSLTVCDTFPENTFSKTVDFNCIGEVADTDDAIAAFSANAAFWSRASVAECIANAAFEANALGKTGGDISAKLYQTADHVDVQRFILRETGYESNKAPKLEAGQWYMIEAEIAKLGNQSEVGIHAFYNHDMGHDGKGGPVLLKIGTEGNLYVNNTDTGYIIDDEEWHKYTLAIRAGEEGASDDENKNWVKLYLDNEQILSEEFATTTRIDGGAFELLPTFTGIKQLWFQNFQKGAFDAEKAASSAAYFDNITVANMGKTKKFDIEILDNEDPVITISGANDGDEFDGDSIPTVTAVASDDYGIAKFEYYLDGELVGSAPEDEDTIVATFEGATGGEHTLKFVAEDIYGITTEQTLNISFVVNKSFTSYSNDFTGYTGGLPADFPQGSTNNHGYMTNVEVDAEHGTSLAVGVAADVDESAEKDKWNSGGGDTAWVGLPADNSAPTQTEFEFNISARPAKYAEENGWQTNFDDFYRMYIRADGEVRFLYIKPDYIELNNVNVVEGSAKIAYDTNKWYTMIISVNPGNTAFGITIKDGDTVLVNATGGSYKGNIQSIRVAGPYHGLSAGHIAIDNLTISSTFGMPEFAAPDEGIAGGVNEFTVKLTESLMAADVTADTLVVENELGEVKVTSAVLTGNDLVVTTASPVFGNMDYTFTLPGTTRFVTGDEVGFVIQNTIKTLPAQIDITEVELGSNVLAFEAVNKTDAGKKVTVIFQTWNSKGQVTEAKAVEVIINVSDSYQGYIAYHGMDVPSGGELTAYIWDGLNKPQAVSPVVYTD